MLSVCVEVSINPGQDRNSCQKIHPEGSGAAGESISKSDSVSDGCWCLFMCLVPCDKSLTLMPADGWGEKDPPSLTHLEKGEQQVVLANSFGFRSAGQDSGSDFSWPSFNFTLQVLAKIAADN